MNASLATIDAFLMDLNNLPVYLTTPVESIEILEASADSTEGRAVMENFPISLTVNVDNTESSNLAALYVANNYLHELDAPLPGYKEAFEAGGAGALLRVDWQFTVIGDGVTSLTRTPSFYEQHLNSFTFCTWNINFMLQATMDAENILFKNAVEAIEQALS